MNRQQIFICSSSSTVLPPPSPYPPSGSSQCTSPKHPVSCIEPGLATRFIHDIIHVSMPFSQISPPSPSPSPSPTESIRLIYTSVSLLLSRTQGYCYHLSKFHHRNTDSACEKLYLYHCGSAAAIAYFIEKSGTDRSGGMAAPKAGATRRGAQT